MGAVHWHLVVVHVPVVGLFFSFILLVCAHITKQEILYKISYSFIIICAVFAVCAYISGPLAYEAQTDLDKEYVDKHAMLGKISFMAMIILGIASFSAIAQYFQEEKPSSLHRYVILCMVVIIMYLLCWTAHTGGAIRHLPIRKTNVFIFPSLGS
ncbi:DUF2231 domain-containing protein [Candidatus Uabimicrobium sp. HlEnr_7]|uniref:DUF2231 domain-containing protein n=1 Tax=Candidatus Uabimicrobium helgolandensis TaxID=3095367 RepID=UPI003557A35C